MSPLLQIAPRSAECYGATAILSYGHEAQARLDLPTLLKSRDVKIGTSSTDPSCHAASVDPRLTRIPALLALEHNRNDPENLSLEPQIPKVFERLVDKIYSTGSHEGKISTSHPTLRVVLAHSDT